jgi:hypothetical protein
MARVVPLRYKSAMKQAYSYRLTPEEFASCVLHRSRRLAAGPFIPAFGFLAAVFFFAGVGYLLAGSMSRSRIASSEVLVATGVMIGSLAIWQMLAGWGVRRGLRRSRFMCQATTLHVESEGLRMSSDGADVFLRWGEIESVDIERDTVFLQLDAISFYPIPLAALGSLEEAREFAAFVSDRRASSPVLASPQLSLPIDGVVPEPQPPRNRLRPFAWRDALTGAVRDAVRLAFFRSPGDGRPAGSWTAVLLAALASVTFPIVVSFVFLGIDGEWSWYSLPSALFHVPVLLGAAILIGYAVGRPAEVPRILVAALLVSTFIDFLAGCTSLAVARFPGWSRILPYSVWFGPAWLSIALATFACRLIEPARRRAVVIACCALLVALPLGGVYRDRSPWHETYSPDDGSGPGGPFGAAAEDVYYKQPTLLSQALQAVRPASGGRINVYFIGMAGYGSQNVFRREVDSVEKIFRQRFGAEGHTIRLINNRQTLLDVPIASKTSLRAALDRMAQVMDKDRDVLVLYMTSHGSEDHRFSLSLWPLDFHEMDPKTLRSMLDESGIRNRVVIVSACYSGGFVEPLKDPDTVVITASASDRNSFGCSNEADWTYFGKAYFDEALRKTHSFTKAFDMAAPQIAERERKEGFDPSQPQISIGADIGRTLALLERQLDGRLDEGGFRLASSAPAHADKYEEYVRLMFTASYADELRGGCESSMQLSGPAATFAKYPDSFGGLERSPAHWRRLVAAWDAYAKDFCAKANDLGTMRGAYDRKVRAAVPEADLDAVLAFLRTPAGSRWVAEEREAVREEGIELARHNRELANTLYKRYLEEQARIVQDFRKTEK